MGHGQLRCVTCAVSSTCVGCGRRALTCNPDRLAVHVANVRAQLMAAGLTHEQFIALVLRSPLAMLLNPVHMSAKLDGLKVCAELPAGTPSASPTRLCTAAALLACVLATALHSLALLVRSIMRACAHMRHQCFSRVEV